MPNLGGVRTALALARHLDQRAKTLVHQLGHRSTSCRADPRASSFRPQAARRGIRRASEGRRAGGRPRRASGAGPVRCVARQGLRQAVALTDIRRPATSLARSPSTRGRPHYDCRLHAKLQVGDVQVQQVGDTQPGNSVRINGGPGLRHHFGAVHQEANLGAPDFYRERVARFPLIIELLDRVVRSPVDDRWRLLAHALLDEELAILPDDEVRIALIGPR